jgi:hypothetical protein
MTTANIVKQSDCLHKRLRQSSRIGRPNGVDSTITPEHIALAIINAAEMAGADAICPRYGSSSRRRSRCGVRCRAHRGRRSSTEILQLTGKGTRYPISLEQAVRRRPSRRSQAPRRQVPRHDLPRRARLLGTAPTPNLDPTVREPGCVANGRIPRTGSTITSITSNANVGRTSGSRGFGVLDPLDYEFACGQANHKRGKPVTNSPHSAAGGHHRLTKCG